MNRPSAAPAPIRIRRALLSVSDKAGLLDLARALTEHAVELISTGGTAAALTEAGFTVIPVHEVTGFPEMMDGRVKTLHPKIHGGILARRSDPEHVRALADHAITPIDLVCVSLYPFERTVAQPDVAFDDAVEQIDIGGPSMIRSAAKNHESVAVVTDPAQYASIIDELRANDGALTPELRQRLAHAAFVRTSAYDAAISSYLGDQLASEARAPQPFALPNRLAPTLIKHADLRYGENPHQTAAVYRDPAHQGSSVVTGRQRHGKELSYNNINDAAAALALVEDLARSAPGMFAAAVIKHANPCGTAIAPTPKAAVELALHGDPLAAYGGILALGAVGNAPCSIDAACAEVLCREGIFLEVIIAPSFEDRALERIKIRSTNVRLLEVDPISPAPPASELTFRSLPGGALAQSADRAPVDPSAWNLHTGQRPDAHALRAASAVWIMAKHLASNAIAIGGPDAHCPGGVRLFGAGAGQMDRVTSCRLAVEKAGPLARGAIAASDAFFPFPDGPALLLDAGVKTIVHPGGSKRDQETFDLCKARGATCLTTSVRHFRH